MHTLVTAKEATLQELRGHVGLYPCAVTNCMPDGMNQPSGARAKNTAGHVGNKYSNY